jgi:hypothetical protein
MLDKEANIFEVPYLYGKHGRICGGHKCEGDCALPGEVCLTVPKGLLMPRGIRKVRQKSAEGIVGLLDRAEGPNMVYETGALNFDGERDADK